PPSSPHAGRRRSERHSRDGFAPRNALHCRGGAAWCVGAHFRGLTIPQGAVPGRAPGFGHMAPTYLCRFPGSASYGRRGSALIIVVTRALPFSRHPEVRAKRASKGDGPSTSAVILRGPRCARAPQDDGSRVETIANEKAELRVAAQARRDALS